MHGAFFIDNIIGLILLMQSQEGFTYIYINYICWYVVLQACT